MSDSLPSTSSSTALQSLAWLAIGRTGADIEKLVREVRQQARRDRRELTWTDIEQALGAQRMTMSDDLRWRVAVHEAGHAMAWTLLDIGKVESVTIGLREMGEVAVDRYRHLAQTEIWLTRVMAAILAGRVAEQLVIGEVMAGSGGGDESDLAKATLVALDAETSLGFSEHQPLIYRASLRGFDVLTLDRELAERVYGRLIAAETLAHDLLVRHEANVLRIATRLSKTGVMSGEELRQLMGIDGDGTPAEDS
tara:strand:+ start:22210 stop:22965 length:756 start_codon:yes stop_codon:yes gene_type:complete